MTTSNTLLEEYPSIVAYCTGIGDYSIGENFVSVLKFCHQIRCTHDSVLEKILKIQKRTQFLKKFQKKKDNYTIKWSIHLQNIMIERK